MQRTGSTRGLRGTSQVPSAGGAGTPMYMPDPSGSRPAAPRGSYYLTSDEEPLAPYTAIASTQASMSTFPSRLRLGTSTLMQPLTTQAKEVHDQPPQQQQQQQQQHLAVQAAAAAAAPSPSIPSEYGLGRRARSTVNYSESQTHLNDFDDYVDDVGSPAPAPASAKQQRSAGTPVQQQKDGREALHNWVPPRSYLGAAPPGRYILAEPAKKTRHLYAPQHDLAKKAAAQSVLVPIRIELDTEAHRIRDQFMWNTREDMITPEHYAAVFCEDAGLPESFRSQVSGAIRAQLDEHASVAEISLVPDLADDQPTPEDRIEADPDLRVVLTIDVQLGMLRLVDKMEWDLGSPHPPELVAQSLCADLSLPTEAAPTLAHAIHEEVLRAKRECLELGILGDMSHVRGAKKMEGVWREWGDTLDFGPRVELMDWDELEAWEKERDRANKRAKRTAAVAGPRRRR